MNEFSDVFLEELLGILPDRDVKFSFEVAPGTNLISCSPYYMTPLELKELKAHLKELLDKGFNQPSVSPWGAPILFVKKQDETLRLCIDYRQVCHIPKNGLVGIMLVNQECSHLGFS